MDPEEWKQLWEKADVAFLRLHVYSHAVQVGVIVYGQ